MDISFSQKIHNSGLAIFFKFYYDRLRIRGDKMKILSILNGVCDQKLHDMIERFAFREGFATLTLPEFLAEGCGEKRCVAIMYFDLAGLKGITKELISVLYMQSPIILVPSSEQEWIQDEPRCPYVSEYVKYPFTAREFHRLTYWYIGDQQLRERTLCFGDLCIDRYCHEICLSGKKLCISGYEYDIFLVLMENLGRVVTREKINQYLPQRKRESARNVDTHIKNLRRQLGIQDLIKCVRSVGYCIPVDNFYRKCKDL